MSTPTPRFGTDRADKLLLRSDRRRAWLMAAMAFALVLIYLFIWMTYAGSHTYSRFRQLPAGDSTTVKGVTFKLLSLTRTPVIIDGDETHRAQAGATYVIADLQLVTDNKDPLCSVKLVADGKRTWESNADFFERKKPQFCGDDEHPITPGKPWEYEQIYLIPTALEDRLYGIGVDDATSPAPIEVLTPPHQ